MYLRMAKRVLLETDKRLVWKLAWNMGFKGMRSVQKFKRRRRQGDEREPVEPAESLAKRIYKRAP